MFFFYDDEDDSWGGFEDNDGYGGGEGGATGSDDDADYGGESEKYKEAVKNIVSFDDDYGINPEYRAVIDESKGYGKTTMGFVGADGDKLDRRDLTPEELWKNKLIGMVPSILGSLFGPWGLAAGTGVGAYGMNKYQSGIGPDMTGWSDEAKQRWADNIAIDGGTGAPGNIEAFGGGNRGGSQPRNTGNASGYLGEEDQYGGGGNPIADLTDPNVDFFNPIQPEEPSVLNQMQGLGTYDTIRAMNPALYPNYQAPPQAEQGMSVLQNMFGGYTGG